MVFLTVVNCYFTFYLIVLFYFWAAEGNWTPDLFLTKEVLYLWATVAGILNVEPDLRLARSLIKTGSR